MVGLTGAILGVISSGALFAGPDSEPRQDPAPIAIQQNLKADLAAESAPPAVVDDSLASPGSFTPAAGVFTKDLESQEDAVTVAAVAVIAPDREAVGSPAVAAAPAAPEPAGAAIEAAAGEVPETGASTAAADPSLWPEEAVGCPRDWVAGAAEPGAAPADCRDATAPLPEIATAPSEQSALDEAAVERASEEAGLQFAARLPMPRPEYSPPPRRKSVTKAGAKRPADPPPNCGKKRAKWRYVDRVPTWYCK